MKTNSKLTAGVLALAMTLTAMPLSALSASAAGYAQGDVDMDGVITGHDSAMVSRYLYDEGYTLTDEELALADMDGDGTIDQSDLEAIHGQEVYMIGDVQKTGEKNTSLNNAYYTLVFWSYQCLGASIDVITSEINGNGVSENNADWVLDGVMAFKEAVESGEDTRTCTDNLGFSIDAVSYHLMDADADGKVTYYDAFNLLIGNGRASLSSGSQKYDALASFYGVRGRYDVVYTEPDENGYTILVEKENVA